MCLVAKARTQYRQGDQAKELIPFAGALYALRDQEHYANELRSLRRKLLAHADFLVSPEADAYYGSRWEERGAVLVACLSWMSEQGSFSRAARDHLRATAMHIRKACLLIAMG